MTLLKNIYNSFMNEYVINKYYFTTKIARSSLIFSAVSREIEDIAEGRNDASSVGFCIYFLIFKVNFCCCCC